MAHVFECGVGGDQSEDFTPVHTGVGIVKVEGDEYPVLTAKFVSGEFESHAEAMDELMCPSFGHTELYGLKVIIHS